MRVGGQDEQSTASSLIGRTDTWPGALIATAAAAGTDAATPVREAAAPSAAASQQQQQYGQHVFVVAEPFDGDLTIELWDYEGIAKSWEANVPLSSIRPRLTNEPAEDKKIFLERCQFHPSSTLMTTTNGLSARGRPSTSLPKTGSMSNHAYLSMRLALEGGMHVVDELPKYLSSTMPSAKTLAPPPLGKLEVEVKGAAVTQRPSGGDDLRMDLFAVAKFERVWVRTRTVTGNACPTWRDKCTFNVHELSTVLSNGVFEQRPGVTKEVGRIRVRISTLEHGRRYTNFHPLVRISKGGLKVKEVGHVELSLCFSCVATVATMVKHYMGPMLLPMHYTDPLPKEKEESLRRRATKIVAEHLAAETPPLPSEVVYYLADGDPRRLSSIRRVNTNIQRLKVLAVWVMDAASLLASIQSWTNIPLTVSVIVGYVFALSAPAYILPMFFFIAFLRGVYFFFLRPKTPQCIDITLSNSEQTPERKEEVVESRSFGRGGLYATSMRFLQGVTTAVMRPEELELFRGVVNVQNAVEAAIECAERLGEIFSWRDPWASAIVTAGSLLLSVILCIVPFRPLALCMGLWLLRPPFLQSKLVVPSGFFDRLPSKADVVF